MLTNNYRARSFAIKNNRVVVKWKKKIVKENIPISVKNELYETHPELIGIFVKSAPAILLSNLSSNVSEIIVNGSKGIMEALFYEDENDSKEANKKIREAEKKMN